MSILEGRLGVARPAPWAPKPAGHPPTHRARARARGASASGSARSPSSWGALPLQSAWPPPLAPRRRPLLARRRRLTTCRWPPPFSLPAAARGRRRSAWAGSSGPAPGAPLLAGPLRRAPARSGLGAWLPAPARPRVFVGIRVLTPAPQSAPARALPRGSYPPDGGCAVVTRATQSGKPPGARCPCTTCQPG